MLFEVQLKSIKSQGNSVWNYVFEAEIENMFEVMYFIWNQ
jgi:hypothetical protein